MRIEPGIAARVPTPAIFGTDPIATCAALVSANAAPRGLQIRFSEKPKFVTARSAAKRRINGPGDKTRRISRCNRMRPAQRIPAHAGAVQSHAKNTSTLAGERTSHASRIVAGRIDPSSLTSIGFRSRWTSRSPTVIPVACRAPKCSGTWRPTATARANGLGKLLAPIRLALPSFVGEASCPTRIQSRQRAFAWHSSRSRTKASATSSLGAGGSAKRCQGFSS